MNHPDKYIAKRYDTPNRSKSFTDTVYRSGGADRSLLYSRRACRRTIWMELAYMGGGKVKGA